MDIKYYGKKILRLLFVLFGIYIVGIILFILFGLVMKGKPFWDTLMGI